MDENEIRPAQAGPSLVQIASRLVNRPLLLHPSKAELILHVLEGRLPLDMGGAALPIDASRFVGSNRRENGGYSVNKAYGGVAVITIDGSLVNRGAWIGASSGLVSYEGIAAQIRDAANDPQISQILLDINSPGGEATGMFALAALVATVNQTKRVTAFVNDMAASAAYGIASAASEIIVSPTSIVGSIGVVLTHFDRSAELEQKGVKATLIYAGDNKVDGHPFGPLSDSVRADLQAEVGKFYEMFVGLVAAGRGAKLTSDMARATQARTFMGEDAIKGGLADRVLSLDALLAELSSGPAAGPAAKRNTGMTGQNTNAQADAGAITQAQVDAAVATARADAIAGERARIAGILNHAEAAGRIEQAQAIALETDMGAEAAGKILATGAKASTEMSLADRSAEAGSIGGHGGHAPAPNAGAAADAAWSNAVAKLNKLNGK